MCRIKRLGRVSFAGLMLVTHSGLLCFDSSCEKLAQSLPGHGLSAKKLTNRGSHTSFSRRSIRDNLFTKSCTRRMESPATSTIESFVMTGDTGCTPEKPASKSKIGSNGRTLLCTRDPDSNVVVVVNAASGTGNLREIQLPAHVDTPPPDCTMFSTTTTSRSCGTGFYIGPEDVGKHYGTCLHSSCALETKKTFNKSACTPTEEWVYGGPWDAGKHGGYCARITEPEWLLKSRPIRAGTCGHDESYVGPANAWKHGGYCFYLERTGPSDQKIDLALKGLPLPEDQLKELGIEPTKEPSN